MMKSTLQSRSSTFISSTLMTRQPSGTEAGLSIIIRQGHPDFLDLPSRRRDASDEKDVTLGGHSAEP